MHIRTALVGLMVLAACIAIPTVTHSAGITIITHGQASSDDLQPWVTGMATAIGGRMGETFAHYRIRMSANSATSFSYTRGLLSSRPSETESGNIIIELDWSELAQGYIDWSAPSITPDWPTSLIAAEIVTLLTTTDGLPWHTYAAAELPIHLIGHSRGGGMMMQ
jgi:hypothetical protein